VAIQDQEIRDYFNPGAAIGFAANTFREVSSLLGNAFLLIFAVVFMLFEASSFQTKLKKAFASASISPEISQFTESVKQYFVLKTLFSLLTGILVWLLLLFAGVDFAVLWAMLAVLLNYVPSIGSIIAAVPAVLLAAAQYGLGVSLGVAAGYLVLNVLIGNVFEPRYMGQNLGLSTLVVFLSLVFWGWLWGPLGMLLAVPLTMIVKIALESFEDTRWIAVLLSDR
jgi:predicted PurR-regulated permease PerM